MSLRLYLHKNIVEFLNHKIETSPPYVNLDYLDLNKGQLFNYNIDNFYWLIDKIINPKSNTFKSTDINGFTFVTLCSEYLRKWIGKDYKVYINYLINNGILLANNKYDINKCKQYHLFIDISIKYDYCIPDNTSFKLLDTVNTNNSTDLKNRNYLSFVEVSLNPKSKISQKIIKEYKLELGRNRKYPQFLKTMSQFFRKNLKINYKEAIQYCINQINEETLELESKFKNKTINEIELHKKHKEILNRYNQRISSINNLHFGKKNKSLKFNRNSSNKRIDTNLTYLAKDIRKFITGIENMSYLDLSNSQPVLFNIILKKYHNKADSKFKNEIKKYYLATITGNWYEELCKVFNLNPDSNHDRDIAKNKWMKIAYSKNKSYKTLKNKFKKHYPEINKVIEKIKTQTKNKSKEKPHAKFAIKLQRIESKIFIDEVCKKLVENKIIPYSIHDGVLVPKKSENFTYNIMSEILCNHLGSVPVISINDCKKYHIENTNENLEHQFESFVNN